MPYSIDVEGTEHEFEVEPGETLLDAAERQGLALPYSCRKGVCNTCRGRLVAGNAGVRGKGDVTGPADGVLFCQTRPQSDLTIAPSAIHKVDPVSRKTVQARIRSKAHVAPDVVRLTLRFPIGTRVPFEAGQYLRVTFDQGQTRNFSMANAPRRNDGCELHIRIVPGGRFSERALADLQEGDTLEVELPFGNFAVDRTSQVPAILLAGGTGFAPIASIVRAQIADHTRRPMHLYWGARTEEGLYDLGTARKWEAAHDWLRLTPVLSEPGPGWNGRTGLVHEAVLADRPDLSGVEVFACGAPGMIEAAERDFTGRGGLSPDAFLADAFVATE